MKKTVIQIVDRVEKDRNYQFYLLLCLLLLFSQFVFSLILGSVKIPAKDVLSLFIGKKFENYEIVVYLRLPRILISIIVGANLAVSGVLLQAVMRNPLVDPGITGVSSGASIFAIIVMLYFPDYLYFLPIISFFGGLLASVLVYLVAWKNGLSPVRIVLSGIAINAFLGSISSIIAILNSDKIAGILTWLNGSIAGRNWKHVSILLAYSPILLLISFLLSKACDLISLDEKNSMSIGVNVNLYRMLISFVAIFLASLSTSIVGIVGFLALTAPHISRFLIGSSHKHLIPISILIGSNILLFADTLSRNMAKPYEIPVGITMSMFGAPFFIYLLKRRRKND